MKLKVLEQMDAAFAGRVPIRNPIRALKVARTVGPVDPVYPEYGIKLRHELRLTFQTILPDGAPDGALAAAVQKKARQALAFTLYGEVEDQIRQALIELREQLLDDSIGIQRLEALVLLLRGEEIPECF